MRRLLFIPFNLLSHVGRCVTLAKSLGNELEVIFLISPSYAKFVERHDFTYYLNSNDESDLLKKIKQFDFSWINEENIKTNFSDLIKNLEKIKPDIVISDSNIFASLACEYLDIPHISLVNTYMTQYFNERHTDLSYLNFALRAFLKILFKLIPEEKRNFTLSMGENIFLKKFHLPFKTVRKELKLTTKEHLFEEYEGEMVFLLDPSEIFPIEENHKVKVIGPVYYDINVQSDEELPTFSENKPNIVITLGSSGDLRKFLFLEKLNLSEKFNVILLGDLACRLNIDKAQKFRYVNIGKISNATDAVICHGGNGTVYSFLRSGVPSIMIPTHIEQYWFSYQIQKSGLGEIYKNEKYIVDMLEKWIAIRRSGTLTKISDLFDVDKSIAKFKSYLLEFIKNKFN
ncbi:MAG: glycosyltransferase [Candidatus Kryptonium sp.]